MLANKQDLPTAWPVTRIETELGLSDLAGGGALWHLESCCAVTGEGLDTGLEHLHRLIVKRKKMAKRARNKTR